MKKRWSTMGNEGLAGLRRRVFQLRGGIWTVFFLALLAFARPSPWSCVGGMLPVLGGQLLRFWAAGTIGRYRGERVGASQLVTWGPYAFVRNPLYLGNALIGLGWATMANTPGAFWGFLLTFLAVYVGMIVPHEESFLREKFGDAYGTYRSQTPMLFPRLSSSWRNWRGAFDHAVLWHSERHSVWMTLGGTAVMCSRLWW